MAKLVTAPTVPEFANAWTSDFAVAVRDEARGGRLDDRGVERIAARNDRLRLYADNAGNYLRGVEQKSVKVEKLIASGHRYATAQGLNVAPAPGEKITLAKARQMNADVVPDFFALRGKELAAGRELFRALEPIAEDLTLGMFGEDSGGACKAVFRKGPVASLEAESALRLFGFNPDKQIGSETFDFRRHDPKDEEFWSSFVGSQFDEGLGIKARELLGGSNVVELASMIIEDRRAFGAPVYLLARLTDGTVAGLKGSVGGQIL